MIEFGGIIYYIDLKVLDKVLSPDGFKPSDKVTSTTITTTKDASGDVISIEEVENSMLRGKEIDAAKFEIIRTMIEIILDFDDDETDTSLGAERALEKTPLSYKIAFNTLLHYGIIKEQE
jgi:hypothetical protein